MIKRRSFRGGLRSVSLGLVMALGAVAGIPAQASPVDAQSAEFACTVVASPDGFDVNWTPGAWAGGSGGDSADRFIVERKVFRSFFWRGRTDVDKSSFQDSGTPKNVGQVSYRVSARLGSKTLEQVQCSAGDTPGFTCDQVQLDNGRFDVSWQSPAAPSGAKVDFVLRRSVKPEGALFWRTRTDATAYSDSASPTGSANYVVLQRVDRRVVGMTNCTAGDVTPPNECQLVRTLGPERPRFSVGRPFTDGSLYYRTESFDPAVPEVLVQIDAAVAETAVLGALPGAFATPLFVEPDGSVVLTLRTEELGAELWRFDRPTGTFALIEDINPGPANSFPAGYAVSSGPPLVSASDGSGQQLYSYDVATKSLSKIDSFSELGFFNVFVMADGPGNRIYLTGLNQDFIRTFVEYDRNNDTYKDLGYTEVNRVLSAPDGNIYFGSDGDLDDEGLFRLNPATGVIDKVVNTFDVQSIGQLAAGPGDLIFYSIVDERSFGRLWAYDTSTGESIAIDNPSTSSPTQPLLGNDGRYYLTSTRGGIATVYWSWDPALGITEVLDTAAIGVDPVGQLAVGGDGSLIVVDGADGLVKAIDPSCLSG